MSACYWFRCEEPAEVRIQAVDIATGGVAEAAPFRIEYCYLHAAEVFEQGHLYNRANKDERHKVPSTPTPEGTVAALRFDSEPLAFDPSNHVGGYEMEPVKLDPLTRCKFCHHTRDSHIIGGGCHVEPRPGFVCGCREFKE